jgi:hypothetical protein
MAERGSELGAAIDALGEAPSAEAVFRAFARWAGSGPVDRAWLAVDHPYAVGEPTRPGAWDLEVELVGERGGEGVAGVVLAYPLPDALRARLDAPSAQRAWAEAPERADRLWGEFRRRLAPALEPFAPRVRRLVPAR